MGKSLKYLNIQPDNAKDEKEGETAKVPDVVGQSAEDAIGILAGAELDYDMSENGEENFVVVKQYPSAGSTVRKGTKVFLYKDW